MQLWYRAVVPTLEVQVNPFGKDVARRFAWQDRVGAPWEIVQRGDEPGSMEWFGRLQGTSGRWLCEASVQTHDRFGELLERGRLLDVKVCDLFENRGLGSMLVQEAIRECQQQGNRAIWGELARQHSDHFDKLQHFYGKLGFRVTFYPEPSPRKAILGEVALEFSGR